MVNEKERGLAVSHVKWIGDNSGLHLDTTTTTIAILTLSRLVRASGTCLTWVYVLKQMTGEGKTEARVCTGQYVDGYGNEPKCLQLSRLLACSRKG